MRRDHAMILQKLLHATSHFPFLRRVAGSQLRIYAHLAASIALWRHAHVSSGQPDARTCAYGRQTQAAETIAEPMTRSGSIELMFG
mmetsp:Transcript_36749/g.97101  ORF Transcript_36749/g.97101 Transcript_36749/m.97101 type:complete len:86 (-) Transcript_36749:473-730(-)